MFLYRNRHSIEMSIFASSFYFILFFFSLLFPRNMEVQIDQDLYSRQIFALGLDTLQALAKMNVLLVGLGGLGIEVAKNLVLAGPRSVTLFDSETATWNDLSSQFFLEEEDVLNRRSRAASSLAKVAELNPYVRVALHEGLLTDAFLAQFEVMVLCNGSQELALRLDSFCHQHGKGFIRGEARGPFGSIFVDFGPSFQIRDTDGRSKEEYDVFFSFLFFFSFLLSF